MLPLECNVPKPGIRPPRVTAAKQSLAVTVVAAVAAAQLREAVGQDAAFEEGVELVFDELRQVGASSVFGHRDAIRLVEG